MMKKIAPFCLFSIFLVIPVGADDVTESRTNLTDSTLSKADENLAKLWSLTNKEYKEFRVIMQGPRGTWSPNLDPVTVLGINAKTSAERERYAEKLVRIERERVEKELAFEMAYQKAQKKLFGHIPLYETKVSKVDALLNGVDEGRKAPVINLFVSNDCEECLTVARRLVSTKAAKVNIFFVGFNSKSIEAWALDAGVTKEMISGGKIVLSFGDKRANKMNITEYPFIQGSK